MRSLPTSRPESPDEVDRDDDGVGSRIMKVSFRKGGDKPFYALLKRNIQSKAWEVPVFLPILILPHLISSFRLNLRGLRDQTQVDLQGHQESVSSSPSNVESND